MQDPQVIAICLQEGSDLYGWNPLDPELVERLSEKRNEKQKQLAKLYGKRDRTEDSLKLNEEWSAPAWFPLKRLSLGVLVRTAYWAGQKAALLHSKPIMGAILYGFSSNEPFYLFSIHVPYLDRNPTYIKETLNGISDVTKAEGNEATWMCAGDFNFPAAHENGLESYAPNMRRPGILTTKRNEYDYCYVGGRAFSYLGASVHVHRTPLSDHHPVHFLFAPWPQIPKHAAELASKLASQSDNASSRSVYQLYHRGYPTGSLIRK